MVAGVATTCEECDGQRFQPAVLDHTLGGRTFAEVLAMSAAEAEAFFARARRAPPAAQQGGVYFLPGPPPASI